MNKKTIHRVEKYKQGLDSISNTLDGKETIYAGIRPWGYHPGNSIVLAIYPHLLAEKVSERGINPEFKYTITINDMESVKYDFDNFCPLDTSFEFAHNIASTEKVINKDLEHMLKAFPDIDISFVKSSSFKNTREFSKVSEILINQKKWFANNYLKESYLDGKNVDEMQFMGLICNECNEPILNTAYEDNIFFGYCNNCDRMYSGSQEVMNFWMYYVGLIGMKLSIIQPDVALLGCDYIQTEQERAESLTKDNPLDSIMKFYDSLGGRQLNFLLGPVLLSRDGRKMSKTFNNIEYLPYEKVYSICQKHTEREIRCL